MKDASDPFYEARQRLRGHIGNKATHYSALTITDADADGIVPLEWDYYEKRAVSQYSAPHLERLGFLRIDPLENIYLKAIAHVIDSVEQTQDIRIDVDDIPLDDPAVFEMLGEGRVSGVYLHFTFEDRERFKVARPKTLEELVEFLWGDNVSHRQINNGDYGHAALLLWTAWFKVHYTEKYIEALLECGWTRTQW